MFPKKRHVYLFYLTVDLFLIGFSFYLSFLLNSAFFFGDFSVLKAYLSTFAFWTATLVLLLSNAQLYYTDRYLSISNEWWKVNRCVLFSAILTALFIFITKLEVISRLVFIETTFFLGVSLSVWRTLKRLYVRHLVQTGYANYNVLVVGAGKEGVLLCEEVRNNPYLGLQVIGFLDDVRTNSVKGISILGKIDDLEVIVKKHFIDEIYITIPSERKITTEIIQKGMKLGRTVRIVAEQFGSTFKQVKLNYIGSIPLMTYFERKLHGTENSMKRLMDVAFASMILFLVSPLFMTIAFLIKLESNGPVFYISKRCGRKGNVFNFYKFRSMVWNADTYKEYLRNKHDVRSPIFKIREDPRITRLGRFLRRYSLDELPQLINVLKGDMSLVGPRPFPVEESEQIEYKHISRLNIKPGMTGLAQIKGRSDLTFDHWMRWDSWYLNNWSLGLDIRILWWTIPVIINGRGAY